ncbi:MAG: DUF4422 domain-containing protein [Gallionellaceae bacterium]|nr:DUF4422 domain-containing protein [Gallionellaceae bacterium]
MSIYTAIHKNAEIPVADWLLPIGLGGYTGDPVRLSDATGDSISGKNQFYCELTATYWLWKNCQDPYIGLCHYRRLFSFLPVPIPTPPRRFLSFRRKRGPRISHEPIVKAEATPELLAFLAAPEQHQRLTALLEHYEMVVPQPVQQYPSIAEAYFQAHDQIGWAEFVAACHEEFGDIARTLDLETRFHPGNMLVARADIFKEYCASLFRVLDRVFDQVGIPDQEPGARYQPYRYIGYLGERFTGLYLLANRTRYATAQIVELR